MLKRITIPPSGYELYTRYFEADGEDGDSVTVTAAPRKNRGTDYSEVGTVTAAPRANRGTNYGADEAEEPTEDAPADEGGPETTGTDYSEEPAANAETGEEPTADTADAPEDTAGDDGEDADGPYTGEDDGGPTDYSDTDTEDTTDTEGDSSNDSEEQMSEEEKEEATKKYHMYKRFVHLYNVLQSLIERCRNVVKNDPFQNTVIKTVVNNLSDIYDNLFDYMTIKYKSATYVQVLIYFENAISAIRLNFELLRNNKINLKQ